MIINKDYIKIYQNKTGTFIFPKLNFIDDYFLNYSKDSFFPFSNKFNQFYCHCKQIYILHENVQK